MIRNVCIHVNNEQPLLADLYDMPSPADVGLVCTNVRMMDGKRPVFIDSTDATFFFPYHVVRFIEIPSAALEEHLPEPDPARDRSGASGTDRAADPRAQAGANGSGRGNRTASHGAATDLPELRLPVPVGARSDDLTAGDENLEIDEDFLQRVRDI